MLTGLKARYASQWHVSVRREHYAYNYLMWLIAPHGFILEYSGLGAGNSQYISRWYDSALEALDLAVYTLDGRLVAFIDVTGYSDPRRAVGDSKRCIGSWKMHKALEIEKQLKLNANQIWYAHFTDTRHILAFINAYRLRELVDKGKAEKRWLYMDEHHSYCLSLKHWQTPAQFLTWLNQQAKWVK